MDTPENREAPIHVHFGAGLHAAAGRPVDASAYEQYIGRWSRLFVPAVLAAAEVASGDRVLDVATGPGEAALSALPMVTPAGRVIGADISPAMLTAARARLGAGAFQPVAMDGQALAFRDGSFDAVVCQLGLQFFPDPARGLDGVPARPPCGRVYRRLRPARPRTGPRCGASSLRHSAASCLSSAKHSTSPSRWPIPSGSHTCLRWQAFATSGYSVRRAKGPLSRSTTTGLLSKPGQGSCRRRISHCLPHVVRQYGRRWTHV